jgi:hypothetical protein
MKSNVKIPRFTFSMVVLSLMVAPIYGQSTIQPPVVGQIPAAISPPDPSNPVKYCLQVLVEDPPSPYILIVPGWGADLQEAKDCALKNARICSQNIKPDWDADYSADCAYLDCPSCCLPCDCPAEAVAARIRQTNLCRVNSKFVYCDGSPDLRITTSGNTYREAIEKARRFLCKYRNPCKRGYLCFCPETY